MQEQIWGSLAFHVVAFFTDVLPVLTHIKTFAISNNDYLIQTTQYP